MEDRLAAAQLERKVDEVLCNRPLVLQLCDHEIHDEILVSGRRIRSLSWNGGDNQDVACVMVQF